MKFVGLDDRLKELEASRYDGEGPLWADGVGQLGTGLNPMVWGSQAAGLQILQNLGEGGGAAVGTGNTV